MTMKRIAMVSAGLLVSGSAVAHTATEVGTGFVAGLMHPIAGWDHLLAAVAVGLWAARHRGRRMWVLPAAFLVAMLGGFVLALGGLALPAIEPAILISLVVLGAALAMPRTAPLGLAAATVAAFALFHGSAHGSEVPTAALLATYGPALLLATAVLHGVGVAAGRMAHPLVTRVAGAALGGAGVWLLAVS